MSRLVKNISIYSLGGILTKSIQFLLLPIYTRVFVPADYGKLELVYIIGAILAIVNGLLVQNAYARFYFDPSDKPHFRSDLYTTALSFMLFCSVITFLVCYYFAGFVADVVFDFSGGENYVRLIAASSLLLAIGNVPEKTLIVQEKAKIFVLINLVNLLITIGLTIYLVVYLKMGIEGVLWAQIAGRFVRFAAMAAVTLQFIRFAFSLRLLYGLLAFSVFLIPTQLSSFVTYLSNRLFLQEFNTLEDVGLFSLAYKISSLIPLVITGPVKMAFGPYIYNQIGDPVKCKSNLKRFTRLFLIFLMSFALIMSMFARELITVMSDPSYVTSYRLVFPLGVSYVFIGLAGIVVTGIQIVKKTWTITITWIIGSVINLALNYLLIREYGSAGASFATILTFLVILILYFIFVEKYYPVKFEYFKYVQIILLAVIFYFISEIVKLPWYLLIGLKVVLALSYLFLCIRVFLEKDELQQLAGMIPGHRLTKILSSLKGAGKKLNR